MWITIATIILIDFLSIITPGQDFAVVTRNALARSRAHGWSAAAGIGMVTLAHCLMAMIGLSALIAAYPSTLAAIKTIGGLYLIYLGSTLIKNAKNLSIDQSEIPGSNLGHREAFKQGAIANIFNIEPIMAFISVFSILLPPDTPLMFKLFICVVLPLNTFFWLCIVAQVFSLNSVQKVLATRLATIEKIIGSVLMFFGMRTLLSKP